jgi:hypothetical protein
MEHIQIKFKKRRLSVKITSCLIGTVQINEVVKKKKKMKRRLHPVAFCGTLPKGPPNFMKLL